MFVFAPLALEPALGRQQVPKVQRWALYLSRFNYVIEHIAGDRNVFADILTRCLKGYRSEKKFLRRICKLHLDSEQLIPSPSSENFVWPNWDMIMHAQERYKGEKRKLAKCDDGILKKGDQIWIPPAELELQLKILVVSHCGIMGHGGRVATESVVREHFVWETMGTDIAEFVGGCIHCIVTRTGETIPRPMGSALHGTKPNEVLHCDFLYMGSGSGKLKYVLIMRDDLSSYTWLWSAQQATAEVAAGALARWIACYGTMKWLVTDQGSHFKNTLIRALAREFHTSHHFTTAYSPWSNGSVGRVCREVLRSCKSLLSEWRLGPDDWPAVTDCVQSILNQSPLKRLGLRSSSTPKVYRTPLEAFCGISPTRPLLRALPASKYAKAKSEDEHRVRKITEIEKTQAAMEEMHNDISCRVTAERARHVIAHNQKCGILPTNFQEGDFVLVRRAQKKGHKLCFVWRGPRRIVAVKSRLVFEVEDLIEKKREMVHAQRLLLYRADCDGKEVGDELRQYAEHSETTYNSVKELQDIRERNNGIEVLVEWDGLPDVVDRTWEPLTNVCEDVPDMLEAYLRSKYKRNLKRKAVGLCSFE